MIWIKCGVDPGRYKIGVAFAEGDRLLFSAIVPKSSEEVLLQSLKEREWKLLAPWIKEGDFKFI